MCEELIYVEEPVVIDGPFHENCILEFQTQYNFVSNLQITTGILKESPISLAGNQKILELSRKD